MNNYNNNQDTTTAGVLHVEVSDVQELFDAVQQEIFDGDDEAYEFVVNIKGRDLDSITLGELSKFAGLFTASNFTTAELLLMLGYTLDIIS